jgi:hypothetical protein
MKTSRVRSGQPREAQLFVHHAEMLLNVVDHFRPPERTTQERDVCSSWSVTLQRLLECGFDHRRRDVLGSTLLQGAQLTVAMLKLDLLDQPAGNERGSG